MTSNPYTPPLHPQPLAHVPYPHFLVFFWNHSLRRYFSTNTPAHPLQPQCFFQNCFLPVYLHSSIILLEHFFLSSSFSCIPLIQASPLLLLFCSLLSHNPIFHRLIAVSSLAGSDSYVERILPPEHNIKLHISIHMHVHILYID